MTEQRKYKCQKCGLMVILYGGRTCDTMVVCNCGAWMDIHHEEDLTPLQNKEDKGKSGEIAFSERCKRIAALSNNPIQEQKGATE